MALAAVIVSILAVAMSLAATWYTRAQAVVRREAEHRQSAPDIEFELGDSLGGGGHELILTSKDRDLHTVTVA
jgi:hypothetical protein